MTEEINVAKDNTFIHDYAIENPSIIDLLMFYNNLYE